MKLQHVTVMFIIIFMPILMVTSYFISLQVETIKLESSYDEKLLKATHDAMTSFELNTANEDLSSVADSLRSIIDASNNIFFNTLCTNMGVSNASKSFVQPFIPAILYTLYDGYYIYSPTNTPEICTDKYGRTIRTSDFGVTYKNSKMVNGKKCGFYIFNNDEIEYSKETPTEPVGGRSFVKYDELSGNGLEQEYGQILYKNKDGSYSTQLHTCTGADVNLSTYYKRSYILKSYIPYSARYFNDSGETPYDITINYTLDNFMTVEGKIGDIYYTKSGYLIKKDLVEYVEVDSVRISSWTQYSKDVLDDYIDKPNEHEIIVGLSNDITISNKDGYVGVSNGDGGVTIEYWDDAQSAVKYYVDSYIFSSWFYENLSDISEKNLINTGYSVADINEAGLSVDSVDNDTSLKNNMLYDFSSSNIKPFDVDNDPENLESDFCKHKRNVIKNSITYNLILSMIVYTEESRTVEFNMPVFKESEWDSILNNVSIVSFMEGLRCGLKYYNNYAIVTGTNNEISVTDNEIYYVPRTVQTINDAGAQIVSNLEDNFGDEIAHRIDCEELNLGGTDNFYDYNWLGCISFKSKEIKYDKILEKDGSYTYDHKAYTDYDCIVDSNYNVTNVDGTKEDGNTDVLKYLLKNVNSEEGDPDLKNNLQLKLKAYRIAIAKERNNLYKTTAFPENYGWQVVYLDPTKKSGESIDLSSLTKNKLSEIEKIEVTIKSMKVTTSATDTVTATYNDSISYDTTKTITNNSELTTLEFKQDFDDDTNVTSIKLSPSKEGTTFEIESIKFYFK